jgi:1,2-diacylglycerol-3-alpha-glucose alpha-1,2-glucosyltransferase
MMMNKERCIPTATPTAGSFTSEFSTNIKARYQLRDMYGISYDKFIVSATEQKHNDNGFEDFVGLATLLPDTMFLWIGNPANSFRSSNRLNALPENVILTGDMDDRSRTKYFSMSDVYISLSHEESLDPAIIDAVAAGLPLILRDLKRYKYLYFYTYLKGRTISDFVLNINLLKSNPNKKKLWQAKAHKLVDVYCGEARAFVVV